MSGGADANGWLVILLHGYDDDPAVFETAVADLAPAGFATRVPTGPVTVGNGRSAWFESAAGEPDPVQLRDALVAIDDLLGEAQDSYAIDHIVLAGFSQGAALALAWLLDAGEHTVDRSAIGGVIAVAPWLPDAEGLTLDPTRAAGVAIFVGHGTDDDVVPVPLGRGAARLLNRNGAPLTYLELDAAHALAPFLAPASAWLADRADSRPS